MHTEPEPPMAINLFTSGAASSGMMVAGGVLAQQTTTPGSDIATSAFGIAIAGAVTGAFTGIAAIYKLWIDWDLKRRPELRLDKEYETKLADAREEVARATSDAAGRIERAEQAYQQELAELRQQNSDLELSRKGIHDERDRLAAELFNALELIRAFQKDMADVKQLLAEQIAPAINANSEGVRKVAREVDIADVPTAPTIEAPYAIKPRVTP